jgi:uncharacterized membrane protein
MIDEHRETTGEKETGRLEAFSDGVFAVAITLLVFDLKVPSPDKAGTPGALVGQLFAQWPFYLAFFLSFATIFVMWVNHHTMFKLIQRSSIPFLFANGFLLLLVTMVPFPTELVATYLTLPAAATACAVYSGFFLVINIAYNLLWRVASSEHRLLKKEVSPALVKKRTRQYLLGFPGYLLAFVLAFWNPGVSIGVCAVLWIFWGLTTFEERVLDISFRSGRKPVRTHPQDTV